MRNLVYVSLLLSSVGGVVAGCKKESLGHSSMVSDSNFSEKSILDVPEESSKYTTLHYMDGKKIDRDKVDYDFSEEDNFVLIDVKMSKENDTLVIVQFFSTKDKYIEFGNDNNLKLKEQLDFEEHMKEYAKESGAIDSFEQNGTVPKWYTEYEESKYNEIFGGEEGKSNNNKTTITILHKNYLGGPDFPFVTTLPFLGGGWNNAVSAFTPIGLFGVTHLYDNAFYRRRMASIRSWGFHRVQLYWGDLYYLNDRTSSALCF